MIRKLALALTIALTAPLSAVAQDLPTAPYLPLDIALKAANTALEACAADGFNVSVAIVARDGNTKVHLMADKAGPHSIKSASGKAFTSASIGLGTSTLVKFIGENPQNAALRNLDPRMVVLSGGLPIKFGKVTVGGIGVGGAPGGHLDEACARAGLASIGVK